MAEAKSAGISVEGGAASYGFDARSVPRRQGYAGVATVGLLIEALSATSADDRVVGGRGGGRIRALGGWEFPRAERSALAC